MSEQAAFQQPDSQPNHAEALAGDQIEVQSQDFVNDPVDDRAQEVSGADEPWTVAAGVEAIGSAELDGGSNAPTDLAESNPDAVVSAACAIAFDRLYSDGDDHKPTAMGKMPALSFNLAKTSGQNASAQTHSAPPNPPTATENQGACAAEQVVPVVAQAAGPSLAELSETDWSAASPEELIAHNRELLGWIVELERALEECQSDFKANLQQYSQQEALLEERTEQLLASQAQAARLSREAEQQQKNYQRQAIRIETLQGQLDSSQERIAQIERECSLAQRRCSDQAQQLLQAEGLCRDLKSRLSRQQRHTLQFKAALEKSLAVSINDLDGELDNITSATLEPPGDFFPRPKPVQPWSTHLDDAAISSAIASLDQFPVRPATAQLPLAGLDWNAEGLRDKPNAAPRVEPPAEPIFDPSQAENLTESLRQETELIIQGSLLAETGAETAAESPCLGEGIAFVPPIVPAQMVQAIAPDVPPEAVAAPSSDTEGESDEGLARLEQRPWIAPLGAVGAQAGGTVQPRKKRTSLAAIDLPCFPRP